jgi:GYF domain 2
MAIRQWFVAIDDKKDGPFSDERLRELIAAGTVTADTLVWCNGMANWTRAAEVPGLMTAATPRRPSLPASSAAPAQTLGGHALATTVGTWGLFGRLLLVFIGHLLIVPAPWVTASFLHWFVEHIQLPEGQRVEFTGKGGDIWYVFMGAALCGYLSLGGQNLGGAGSSLTLVTLLLSAVLNVLILRWFFSHLVWDGQHEPLKFIGGFWAMIGWILFYVISFITIIGWAWVATAWGRWLCRHVTGSSKHLVFTASGLGYLWRLLVLALVSGFIIPIPWITRWFVGWVVSQFSLVDAPPAVDESSVGITRA